MIPGFKDLNYYEILDISPGVERAEIQQGYQRIKEIYSRHSLSTYSLYGEEERKRILELIEEAFHTLNDEGNREIYDRKLAEKRARQQKPEVRQEVLPFAGPITDGQESRPPAGDEDDAEARSVMGIEAHTPADAVGEECRTARVCAEGAGPEDQGMEDPVAAQAPKPAETERGDTGAAEPGGKDEAAPEDGRDDGGKHAAEERELARATDETDEPEGPDHAGQGLSPDREPVAEEAEPEAEAAEEEYLSEAGGPEADRIEDSGPGEASEDGREAQWMEKEAEPPEQPEHAGIREQDPGPERDDDYTEPEAGYDDSDYGGRPGRLENERPTGAPDNRPYRERLAAPPPDEQSASGEIRVLAGSGFFQAKSDTRTRPREERPGAAPYERRAEERRGGPAGQTGRREPVPPPERSGRQRGMDESATLPGDRPRSRLMARESAAAPRDERSDARVGPAREPSGAAPRGPENRPDPYESARLRRAAEVAASREREEERAPSGPRGGRDRAPEREEPERAPAAEARPSEQRPPERRPPERRPPERMEADSPRISAPSADRGSFEETVYNVPVQKSGDGGACPLDHFESDHSGKYLKSLREARGLSLDQVYDVTRIRRPILVAIEAEDLERLPADVFLKGMVLIYARFLEVPRPEDTVKGYMDRLKARREWID